ncbi:MAG: tetratricopeptide repeat protein, partial [Magnetococcales bacterium]|nr:tetratricopeptide repeat protein [Magnetococcales bacterium]
MSIDVLIITALADERDAVRRVLLGRYQIKPDPRSVDDKYPYDYYKIVSGKTPLELALACQGEMGEVETSVVFARLQPYLDPRLLAMVGICAGNPKKVALGDLVVANKLYRVDTGKIAQSEKYQDITTFQIHPELLPKLDDFIPAWVARNPANDRPISLVAQRNWLLHTLYDHKHNNGISPLKHPERANFCPAWTEVVVSLRKTKDLSPHGLNLTDQGLMKVEDDFLLYPDGFPQEKGFQVHVGSMACASQVIENDTIFEDLARYERKTVALDMESYAIGVLSQYWNKRMLVVKGVQDFANRDKEDRFRSFAAERAAWFLLDFLLEHQPRQWQDPLDLRIPHPSGLVESPSRFLDARSATIRFLGRGETLTTLRAWCQSSKRFSVKVLIGEAGVGKTRLAMELCRELENKWQVGFVSREKLASFVKENSASWQPFTSTLVVVDGAASQVDALKTWFSQLEEMGGPIDHPLRLLLLERHGDKESGWWQTLFADRWSLMEEAEPEEVPLLPQSFDRRELLEQVFHAKGSVLTLPAPGEDKLFDTALAQKEWAGRPLFLMMAGLLMVERHAIASVLPLNNGQLIFELVVREGARLDRMVTDPAQKKLVRHIVSVCTLMGGLDRQEFLDRMKTEKEHLRYGTTGDEATIYDLLSPLFPRAGGVGAMQPEVLGEAFVLKNLANGHDQEAKRAVVWAWERDRKGVVGFLIQAVQDCGFEAKQAVSWLDALIELPEVPLAILEEMEGLFPRFCVPLTGVRVRLREKLVLHWRNKVREDSSEESRTNLALWLTNLSICLDEDGEKVKALSTIEEAVEICRELVAANSQVYLPNLALSLNNLSNRLGDLGRHAEALPIIEEAVGIHRTLSSANPQAYLPDLALSLNNLSIGLGELDRPAEALPIIEEAVEIYRTLSSANP